MCAHANTCAHTLTCAYMLLGLAYSLGPPPKCALRQHPTDSPQTKDPEESHFQEGLSCPTRSEISALPASAGCPVHHPCQPAPPIWRAKGCGPRGSGLFPSLPFPPSADLSGCECPAHLGWELQQRALGSVANKPRTWASGRLRRSPQPGAPRTLAGKPSCLCCDRSLHASPTERLRQVAGSSLGRGWGPHFRKQQPPHLTLPQRQAAPTQ